MDGKLEKTQGKPPACEQTAAPIDTSKATDFENSRFKTVDMQTLVGKCLQKGCQPMGIADGGF